MMTAQPGGGGSDVVQTTPRSYREKVGPAEPRGLAWVPGWKKQPTVGGHPRPRPGRGRRGASSRVSEPRPHAACPRFGTPGPEGGALRTLSSESGTKRAGPLLLPAPTPVSGL